MRTLLRNTFLFCLLCIAINARATKTFISASGTTFSPATGVSICLGDTVVWQWVNGSHTTTSNSIPPGATAWNAVLDISNQTYTYVPAVAGSYSYYCIPHQSLGMTGSFTVNGAPATPVISAPNGPSACTGSAVSLQSTAAATGVFYRWYSGTAPVPGGTTQNITVITPGVYTVKDSSTCGASVSNAITVSFNTPPPMPTIMETHTLGTYNFSSTAAATGLTYLWNFGDGTATSAAQTPPAHTYTTGGAKPVSLKVTDANTCNSTGLLTVNVSLGIANIGKHPITIAPNPASNMIVLHTDGAKTAVVLLDAAGRVVSNAPQSASGNDIMIDVRSLAAGTYIVKMSIDGVSDTEKMEVVQ